MKKLFSVAIIFILTFALTACACMGVPFQNTEMTFETIDNTKFASESLNNTESTPDPLGNNGERNTNFYNMGFDMKSTWQQVDLPDTGLGVFDFEAYTFRDSMNGYDISFFYDSKMNSKTHSNIEKYYLSEFVPSFIVMETEYHYVQNMSDTVQNLRYSYFLNSPIPETVDFIVFIDGIMFLLPDGFYNIWALTIYDNVETIIKDMDAFYRTIVVYG